MRLYLLIRVSQVRDLYGLHSTSPPFANILLTLLSLKLFSSSTSGCVRATTIGGLSYKYNVFVVEECTFDRFELSHLVSLWDMNAKYADVITINEALDYVAGLS